MNKQAAENRAYVRTLMLKKFPVLAYALTRAVSDEVWAQVLRERRANEERNETWTSGSDAVTIGFGECETETHPLFGETEYSEDWS